LAWNCRGDFNAKAQSRRDAEKEDFSASLRLLRLCVEIASTNTCKPRFPALIQAILISRVLPVLQLPLGLKINFV
jgi:hypothetical protein